MAGPRGGGGRGSGPGYLVAMPPCRSCAGRRGPGCQQGTTATAAEEHWWDRSGNRAAPRAAAWATRMVEVGRGVEVGQRFADGVRMKAPSLSREDGMLAADLWPMGPSIWVRGARPRVHRQQWRGLRHLA